MGRNLTAGEIALAADVYQHSINYERVKVHKKKYLFFQPNNSGMTPNGEIYVAGDGYSDDYSIFSDVEIKAFFIHEMAHVWQRQNRILNVRMAALLGQFEHKFKYSRAYPYFLRPDSTLLDYGIEQQASMIEDFFRVVKCGGEFCPNRVQNRCSRDETIELLLSVLQDFIIDPTMPFR
jgi:hypothetical protein